MIKKETKLRHYTIKTYDMQVELHMFKTVKFVEMSATLILLPEELLLWNGLKAILDAEEKIIPIGNQFLFVQLQYVLCYTT